MILKKLKLIRARDNEPFIVWGLFDGIGEQQLARKAVEAQVEDSVRIVRDQRGLWLRLGKTRCTHEECALAAAVEHSRELWG